MGVQEEEEEDLFFDSREDLSSVFDSCPGSPAKNDSFPEEQLVGWAPASPRFKLWITSPVGVRERRDKFLKWLGMDLISCPLLSSPNTNRQVQPDNEIQPDINTIVSVCESVPRGSSMENNYSILSCSCEDTSTSYNEALQENLVYRIKNLDDGAVLTVDELGKDGSSRSLHSVDSNRMVKFNEFERSLRPSSFIRRLMRREANASTKSNNSVRRKRIGWLERLAVLFCFVTRQDEENSSSFSDPNNYGIGRSGRVKVRPYKKRSKELSAVYKGQDIKAHDGAILTMKFSPDGQYLASGGADGVVRVWHVMESLSADENSILDNDPSCICFTVNHSAELTPVSADKEKMSRSRHMRRNADSACVVIPPDVFRLAEKPVHEFHGHDADVLDLSWSTNKHLLSSSKDKTVRLWQVGSDSHLKVFCHTNYVTCVQFNPTNDNYFISGSIDGKARIWDISKCQVVDWVDIREIVTAICYRLNGKGVVIGTLTGDCRFYNASDNHLQIEAQISLQGKKKSPYKQITGFQFCPRDPQKLMVTSGDSQIRIFHGIDVVSKYKGFRNTGTQISAYFTGDGQHIISASGDCNVYVWNHVSSDTHMSNHVKSICSCERFFSSNASIAIPWYGLESSNRISMTSDVLHSQQDSSDQVGVIDNDSKCHLEDSYGNNTLCLSPSGSFTLSHEFFSQLLTKGSATWPEEKLPLSSAASTLSMSHYKFLKTSCQNTSHAWGQVILTAGWDGWVRSYQNYGLPVHL